jgi:hypothetical protein
MEIYKISTSTNLKTSIIEEYESFIWTERYSSYGDFQLVMELSDYNIANFKTGTYIGMDESDIFMVVDTVEIKKDEDGKRSLNITGRSFDYLLNNRIAKQSLTSPEWVLNGTPGNVVKYMVDVICVNGTGISQYDVIPNLTSENLSTFPITYDISITPGTLYERIKNICDDFGMGFRIKNILGGNKVFQVYEGSDLTGVNGVAFSEDLDNLSETSTYKSNLDFKNVAYVLAKNGSVIVNRAGTLNPTNSGLDRNVLFVDATNIEDPAGSALTTLLKNKGKQELANYQRVNLFDGLVDPNGIFKYKTDYNLGDLVSFIDEDKNKQTVMVSEYIFTYDSNGYRAYPTLTL